MKKNKVCFLFNYASHYRASIYKLLNDNIDGDFYFGDKLNTPIKKLDYNEMSNFKKEFKRINLFGNFYWLKSSFTTLYRKYDTIVLTGEPHNLSNWLLLLYSKFFNKKTYLWGHGWYGKETWLIGSVKKMFHKLSDGAFLYGDYAKNLMIKEGFDEKDLIPIYNSLDYDTHLKIRETLKVTDIYNNYFQNNYATLIYVGRIQKVKRIDMIFDAMNILREKGVLLNLAIVGDNVDIDLSADFSINEKLRKHIWLYGPCYDENKLGELFYNATVCVSPGNVGLTAIHALSFGTPVISHNNFPYQMPEFEAIVEGETGSFFEQNNVDDLSEKILKYINLSSEKREEIKQACFNMIDERYNPYYQLSVIKRVLERTSSKR